MISKCCGTCVHRKPVWTCYDAPNTVKRICGYKAESCENYSQIEDSQAKWLEDMERFINDQCGAINIEALQKYLERAMRLGSMSGNQGADK